MKKLILLAIVCAVFIGCSQPAEASSRNHRGDPCESFLGSVLNECVGHPTEKNSMKYGVGVDVPLWKSDEVVVDQETRLELNNGVNKDGISTFTVFKPQMEKGLFQIVGNFFAKLFNRE